MKIEIFATTLYINANTKKSECPKEQKLVDTAFKLLLAHPWMYSLEDLRNGCDDEHEYFVSAEFDTDDLPKAHIKEAWKIVKKEAIALCK